MKIPKTCQFVVFGRKICPLCDEVEQQLATLNKTYLVKDIDEDLDLLVRYHTSVPVIRHEASGKEIHYPFTEQELSQFMADC